MKIYLNYKDVNFYNYVSYGLFKVDCYFFYSSATSIIDFYDSLSHELLVSFPLNDVCKSFDISDDLVICFSSYEDCKGFVSDFECSNVRFIFRSDEDLEME